MNVNFFYWLYCTRVGFQLTRRIGISIYSRSSSDLLVSDESITSFDQENGCYIPPSAKCNAYTLAKQHNSHFPCIILVNPMHDQNVGSVARVMLNFGFSDLRIVKPECDIHSLKSEILSSGAFEVIQNAKIYSSLKESMEDLTTVIATSDRTREISQIVIPPSSTASRCFKYEGTGDKVGIMFGRENRGLLNEELLLADVLIKIPTFNPFSSLNLSQAVNLICYEIWKENCLRKDIYPPEEWLEGKGDGDGLATRKDLEPFLNRLCSALGEKVQPNENLRAGLHDKLRTIYQRVSFLYYFFLPD
jgi:TrmH family RNA methyltransferase